MSLAALLAAGLPASLRCWWSELCSAALLLCAAVLQVWSPFWLAHACDGRWAWLATVAICLLLWPLASEQLPGTAASLQFAAALLGLAALARALAARLRARRVHSASGALRRYALANLAGTHPRRRAWSAHGYLLLQAVSAPLQSALPCLVGADLRQVW